VSSCSRFQVRVVVSVPGGPSARGRQTVCKLPTSQLFVMFFVSSCVTLFRSVELGIFGWSRFARLSTWGCRTIHVGRTVRGVATNHPYFKVQYWLFELQFWTVCRGHADRLPTCRGLSARSLRTVCLGSRRVAKSFDS
jgi:hypothetical protein